MNTRLPHLLIALLFSSFGLIGAAQTPLYTVSSDQPTSQFGLAVSEAGDVNADGYADWIVGIPFYADAEVFSGLDGTSLMLLHKPETFFGRAVGNAGDVNADGYDDIIVGAYKGGSLDEGLAFVYSGKDASVLYEKMGDSQNDLFGYSVDGAGDVNADGYADFIVGAINDDDMGENPGGARVFSGLDGAELFTLYGDQPGDLFGYAVSEAGDLNDDGKADVLVTELENGALFIHGPGRIKAFLGDQGTLYFDSPGTFLGDAFGRDVDVAGDVNRDGFVDAIGGAVDPFEPPALWSYARVVSGVDGSEIYTFYGDDIKDDFGDSVAGGGDVDEDGYADLIVGAPFDDDAGAESGTVSVISGMSGNTLVRVVGKFPGDKLGHAVAGLDDANGDLVPDFVAGAPSGDIGGVDQGSAHVYSGQELPLYTDVHLLPLEVGAQQTFFLQAGPTLGGKPYHLVGSVSGISPGLDIGPLVLPLNPDAYLTATYLHPTATPLQGSAGILDASGSAQVTATVPPGVPGSFAGTTVHHAFVVFNGPMPVFVSNAVPLSFKSP